MMKLKLSILIYGRLLCLPFFMILFSCDVGKDTYLQEYNFSVYDSIIIKLNSPEKLRIVQTHTKGDTLVISAADHKEKKLYLFYVLNDSLLDTKNIFLNFLKDDEFPYVMYTYSDYFDAYIVYRDQKDVDYNWNKVFYIVTQDQIKEVNIDCPRLFRKEINDSSKVIFIPTPFEICVFGNTFYGYPIPFNGFKHNPELLSKYNIPHILAINLENGECIDIHNVLPEARFDTLISALNMHFYLTRDERKNRLLLNQRNSFKITGYDLNEKKVKNLTNFDLNIEYFRDHINDYSLVIFDPTPIKKDTTTSYVRQLRIFPKRNISAEAFRTFLLKNNYYLLYDSNLQLDGVFKADQKIYTNIFESKGENFAIQQHDELLKIYKFRLTPTSHKILVRKLLNSIISSAQNIPEIQKFDLNSLNILNEQEIPKYLIIIPLKGCYGCAISALSDILKDNSLFSSENIKIMYSTESPIYITNSNLIDKLDSINKIKIQYSDLNAFLPEEISYVTVCKVLNGKVTQYEEVVSKEQVIEFLNINR